MYPQDQSAYSVAGKYVNRSCGNIYAHRQMNVEIRTEDAQFPEKEFINGISIAVKAKPISAGALLLL